jgi:A/G-specific adenine glycosylase
MVPRKKPAAVGKISISTKPSKMIKPTIPVPDTPISTALPPLRAHHVSYHYPLLLDDKGACYALLNWFEGVEETRSMPWRKKWIDPTEFKGSKEDLDKLLGRRAYEVWVSEVSKYDML